MKKITKSSVLSLVLLLLIVSLAGCWRSKAETSLVGDEAAAIGQTYDVTDKNGEAVTVEPGDVLYLKLEGESQSGWQWSVVSPTSGEFFVLQDHQTVGLDDPDVLDGKFTDEWWIKVQESGESNLQFDYGVPGKADEPQDSFGLKVISQ